MSANLQSAPQDGEIDISMLLHELLKHKLLIFLVTTITLLAGVFYASRQIPQYQSEVLLQIKSDHQGGANLGRLSQQISIGGSQNSPEATQIALIKSRFILVPVTNLLNLNTNIELKQPLLKKLLFPSNAKVSIKRFKVSPQFMNKPFSLVFEGGDRYQLYDQKGRLVFHGQAGRLAINRNKNISLLVDSNPDINNQTFTIKKISDAKIVESLKKKLTITDLGENRQNTGVLAVALKGPDPENIKLILNSISRVVQEKDIQKNAIEASTTLNFLKKQLPITKHDLEKSETELNIYRAKSGKIDIKLQAQYLLTQLSDVDKKLGELRIEKIEKLQHYTVEHPYIIALNTKRRELSLSRSQLELTLKTLPASDQMAVNLMRDVKIKSALYKLLLNKIQELRVTKAGIISEVRVLSYARSADEPIPLKTHLIYVASLLLGLIISLGIIFLRSVLFPRVNDPHWGERHFDLINLAIVPYSKEQTPNAKSASSLEFPLLAHVNPRNLAIEALRSLRTTLQVRLSCASNNIVSILGISPGVGKTFVSANLAYLLATTGKRVLVIDTDMRRGTLHKYYAIPPAPGLAEVLTKKLSLSEAIKSTVQENLYILSRGTYPDSPSELLTGESFKDALDKLSQQFDIVLIDTPPVLLVTDAVLIGVHADTNYIVFGAGAHQPVEIEMSIKRLTSAGVVLNGSIFNFHKQASSAQYGHNKYGSYYDDKEDIT